MKKTPILALIDGTNVTHAVYHALGGAAATTAQLVKTIQKRIDAVANMKTGTTAVSSTMVAFDLPPTPERPSWRKQLYPAYKGHRPERDPALDELLEAAVLTLQSEYEVLALPGVEADDLIATRWQHGIDTGCRMLLVSADRDLFQLLRPASTCQLTGFNTERGKVIKPRYQTYTDFVDEFGFTPLQWPLFKAIYGDKTDNVPGIETLGEKAATHICRNYSTLAEAMADRWRLPLTPRQLVHFDKAIADGSAETFVKICTLDRNVDLDAAFDVRPLGMETQNAHSSNSS
jgi:DNA polymerase I